MELSDSVKKGIQVQSRKKCPKCAGFDGYGQPKNILKGAGWFLRAEQVLVLFCRDCDIEMIDSNPFETGQVEETNFVSGISPWGIGTVLVILIVVVIFVL